LFEVAVSPGAPLLREWAVICDSPTFSACLVGVERLGARPADPLRRFEAMWTVEPFAVRQAARTGCALAAARYPAVAEALGSRLEETSKATYDSIRTATTITNRVIAYLDRG
jgi:DICT domain-containing protein